MTTKYERDIQNRTRWHYIKGLLARWKQHFKYDRAVRIARRRGATIGEGVIMPLSLAKKANSNFVVGDHVSIQTDKIDLRSPVKIGSHVIIGGGYTDNYDKPQHRFSRLGAQILWNRN